MNYDKIYHNIINNRKNNSYEGYVETHHIVPKSLGGTNDKTNLVDLSAREHFICHLLLTKIYSEDTPNYHKMVKAFFMMMVCRSDNQERYITSKKYETLRINFAKAQSLSQSGEKNSQYGKVKSLETRKKISEKTREAMLKLGLGKKRKLKEQKNAENKINREKEIELYRKYYVIYNDVGFESFVEQTDYDKSQSNLVQRFKKLLPEFVPQNGKRRKTL